MSWSPPVSLSERLKALLVPAPLDLRRIVARELRKGELELRLVPMLCDPTRTALDVGANRGIWTAVMARHARAVIAFEPNPKMFVRLQAGAGSIADCRQIAASDSDGTARFVVPRNARGYSNQGGSLALSRVEGQEFGEVEVRAARLDSLDLPPVGFMKVDVEGHEVAALKGARGLIARDRPTLIVEIESRHTGRPVADMVAEIAVLGGYRVMFIGPEGLRDFSAFDQDRLQPSIGPGRERVYINNFVFLAG